MMIFLTYISIGLLWYAVLIALNKTKISLPIIMVGIISYALLYPFFLYLNISKYFKLKKYLKPFGFFNFVFLNSFNSTEESEPELSEEILKDFDDLDPDGSIGVPFKSAPLDGSVFVMDDEEEESNH